jgi:hypothetical protein
MAASVVGDGEFNKIMCGWADHVNGYSNENRIIFFAKQGIWGWGGCF